MLEIAYIFSYHIDDDIIPQTWLSIIVYQFTYVITRQVLLKQFDKQTKDENLATYKIRKKIQDSTFCYVQIKVTFSWHACCVWFSSFANWPEFDLLHSCVALINEWYLAARETREGNTTSQFVFSEFFALKEKNFFTNQPQTWSKQEIMIRSNCFCYTGSFWYIVTNVIIWGFDYMLFIGNK